MPLNIIKSLQELPRDKELWKRLRWVSDVSTVNKAAARDDAAKMPPLVDFLTNPKAQNHSGSSRL